LKSRHDINGIAVEVSPIGNRIADVDPDAKANGPIGGLVAILNRHLLLHLHGALHRAINAIKRNE
jgi:hypothetical protein